MFRHRARKYRGHTTLADSKLQLGLPVTITLDSLFGLTGTVTVVFETELGRDVQHYEVVNGHITIDRILVPVNMDVVQFDSWADNRLS